MKHALGLCALVAATPAIAHPGAHLHSTGPEGWLTAGLALAALAICAGVVHARFRGRK